MEEEEDSAEFCVIDIGTGGAKCLVFDGGGSIIFGDTAPIHFQVDSHAISFVPSAAWSDVCRMTRRAVRECARRKKKIATIVSTSMREGNVFYDREGKELLAVPNLDARAYREAEEIQNSLGEEVYETSGHWPSAIFLACRLKFLSKTKPEFFRKIVKVSMINDWVAYKFSGKIAVEPTNGCETALFSLRERDWSDELIKQLGFDRSLFPEVRECGTVVGELTGDATRESGLPRSTLVITGAADTESAVAGCGLLDPGSAVAIAGTTTPVQAVVKRPVIDAKRRTWTCCHVIPDGWTVESNAGATGLSLRWWAQVTGRGFSELDEEVEKNKPPPGRVGVSMGASVMNAKRPHPLIGGIRGLSPWTPRSQVTLGILEANCFSVRANLEQLESVLGRRYAELYFCGGASQSRLWRTMQAGILGRKLVSFGVAEATGRGAAMLSAVAVGRFQDIAEASKTFVRRKLETQPDALTFETYKTLYHDWLRSSSNC